MNQLSNTSVKIVKPFLKWVGGKTQLLDEILPLVPKNIENYNEIFLGGGSVLLNILQLQKENKIHIHKSINAYDINTHLINLYNVVKNNFEEFYKKSSEIFKEYNSLENFKKIENTQSKEQMFYDTRNKFNNHKKYDVLHACYFYFLE